jgi:hypothetical protein
MFLVACSAIPISSRQRVPNLHNHIGCVDSVLAAPKEVMGVKNTARIPGRPDEVMGDIRRVVRDTVVHD